MQSANIGVKCVTFVFETFTRYGSNITSGWQEIFTSMIWHSLMKLCTKNYENPSIFVKVTAKKISGTFFLDTVYITVILHIFMYKNGIIYQTNVCSICCKLQPSKRQSTTACHLPVTHVCFRHTLLCSKKRDHVSNDKLN